MQPIQPRFALFGATLSVLFATGQTLKCQVPNSPGDVIWGSNRYVEYIVGNAPVVISMPHGGYLKAPQIPDRTYGVTGQDGRTQETGRELARKFRERFGLHPHLIFSHLHRIKLDPNREIVEAAQGDPTAEQAWTEYHGFIGQARTHVVADYGKGLYIDLHGHGHPIDWVELGYLLSSTDLNLSDPALLSSVYRDKSSIRNLSLTHPLVPFPTLLRGANSLGGQLEAGGILTVPSPSNPGPGANSYFSGGYDTAVWGSRNGGTVDGVQFELPSIMRRNWVERDRFTTATIDALDAYFAVYYQIDLAVGPRLTITANSRIAAESGTEYGEFTISRSGSTAGNLAVPLLVTGYATPGQDYDALPANAVILAGRSSTTIRVTPVQDVVSEGDETVCVTLARTASPTQPRLGEPNTATVIITNEEADPFLAGLWRFDEGSGIAAQDDSPSGRTGAHMPLLGGPVHISGQLSGALAFDGVDDRVEIPGFNYAASSEFSISFWFNASPGNPGSPQYLFSHGDVNAANSLNIYRYPDTGLLRTRIRPATDITSSILLDVETDFMDDRWHFYTLTVESGLGYASVYVDGALQIRNQLGGDALAPTGDIFVGCRQDLSSTRFLAGKLDDLMILTRELKPGEVQELFDSSAGYAESFGVGCPTSGQNTPRHGLTGRPALGSSILYTVADAAPSTDGVLLLGLSRTSYLGNPLPLHLGFTGAPGCYLLQDLGAGLPIPIDPSGFGSYLIQIPPTSSLRGLRVYSQIMIYDSNANSAGFVASNGLITQVGG